MPSNNSGSNNIMMAIKFGPNKTAKHFYVRLLLSSFTILLLAILCTVLLFAFSPNVQQSLRQYFYPSPAPLTQTRIKSENRTNANTNATLPFARKLSERNDLDPDFTPVDALPDDLFPSSSVASLETTVSAAASALSAAASSSVAVVTSVAKRQEEERENPNDVRGSVMRVTWIKPKPVDELTGEDIVVKTRLGRVKGIRGSVLPDRMVDAFLGIPFTEHAPIGGRRFTRSIKRSSPWQGVLSAQSFKPHCPQVFDEDVIDKRTVVVHDISEDCLYLNLWSPVQQQQQRTSGAGDSAAAAAAAVPQEQQLKKGKESASGNRVASKLKPVMLWVFGGGYSGGSNNLDEMDGRVLAALGDVIVATVNYRVGSFGFLDMGVGEAPGNMGLYDIMSGLLSSLFAVRSFAVALMFVCW